MPHFGGVILGLSDLLRVCALSFACVAALALAPADSASRCDQLPKPGMSAVVICPPGSDEADWREAGKNACRAPGNCHAWIWTDRNKAPKQPITRETPMNGEEFESAVALWVGYTGTLFICDGRWC